MLSFANLLFKVLAVHYQAINCIKIILNIYIYQVQLFCVSLTNFYHLVNTLANTNSILILNLSHLMNSLINNNDKLKVNFCHLANTLTNIVDKVDNFIKKRLITSN